MARGPGSAWDALHRGDGLDADVRRLWDRTGAPAAWCRRAAELYGSFSGVMEALKRGPIGEIGENVYALRARHAEKRLRDRGAALSMDEQADAANALLVAAMEIERLEAELAAAKLAYGREWRARHCEADPPVEGKAQRRG